METLAQQPANADNTALVATPEADAEGATTNGDGSAPSLTEAQTPAQKKDAVQERIDKLTRDKYDNARLADQRGYALERETAENKRLAAELAELKKAQTSQVAPDKRPTLEQFGYDEARFNEALDAYHEAKSASSTAAAREAALEVLRAEREAEAAEQANKSWATKEAEFIKSKPDYVEKVIDGSKRGAWACTKEMDQVISKSPIGPAIAYHLSENAEKAASIAKLSPLDQAKELGRIEARLEVVKTPPKPVVSQAPPPVKTVDGDAAQVDKDPVAMSDAEFAKWRKRQIAQRR